MKWNSVRVRLALWITVVLAVSLSSFGLILCLSFQRRMNLTLDQDLAIQAHPFSSGKYPLNILLRDLNVRPNHPGTDEPRVPSAPAGGISASPSHAAAERSEPTIPATEVLAQSLNDNTRILLLFKRPRRFGFSNRFKAHDRTLDHDEDKYHRKENPRVRDEEKEEEQEEAGPVVSGPLPTGPWDAEAIPLSLHGAERYATRNLEGHRYRILAVPLRQRERILGIVQIARDLSDYDRQWSSQIQTLLTLLPLSLLAAGAGGLFLTSRVLRPVREVTRAAAQISDRDLTRRLTVIGEDEFAELAATFNGMIARLETAFKHREDAYNRLNAAYEQQQRFTADASHELRTPLSRIKVSTSMALADEQTEEEYRTALVVADQAADVMNRLIQQLLLLASADAGQLALHWQAVDVAQVLRATIAMVPNPQNTPIRMVMPSEPPALTVQGDPDHLTRIVTNLLENALRHTAPTGQVTISARRSPRDSQCAVLIEIADTGEGISPEHLPHILERFYRADAARTRNRGGSGLGLSITQSLVQAHGGSLTITSEVGRGTIVTVCLPEA